MNRKMRAAASLAAMFGSLPAFAQAFENCAYDCRDAYAASIRLCAGGRRPEIVRSCRERADRTRMNCMNQCTARENARLRLIQARDQEAAERRRLRGQPESPHPPR